ncbi:hypothetical protein H7J77_01640 [Mycolicibacillus parakoreensis]|uniref:Uncharacterized protein n=1 Tax=Mycolicibacillus parakoreensis TaxID=1069221 RepID=A0ABY3TZ35_9MYCO|nr:hypothetical protein [Mycolicibacillus parakoreensis]MCV7314253.1 hypothetical protein [Mycolicibacillus parakoreensis]ULN52964.1 hypothetical protein MIU77_00795 [Mycolicibacillus parakoreensis]
MSTEGLASAAGEAEATLAASVVSGVLPPPATTASALDGALAVLVAATEARRADADTADHTWASRQATALAESPPQLQEQDGHNAERIQRVPQRFPMPTVVPRAPGAVFRI